MSAPRRTGDNRLLRRYAQVMLLWNPLICAAITLLHGVREFWIRFAISLSISVIVASLCFGVVYLTRWAEVRWAERRGRPAPEHGTGWYFALSMLMMPFGLFLAFQLVGTAFGFEVPFRFEQYRFGLLLGGGIAGAFLLWETRADARDAARVAELRIGELEKRELQSQLAALTAQMNPHLLFNALNTVAALIPSDPRKAEETIVRLAELYRGVIAASQRTTHPLDEELRLCEAYLMVEQARFGERLQSRVEIADELRGQPVPVLLLQPLVENAVKHGLAPRAAGGAITIRGRLVDQTLELVVEDDGVGLGADARPGAGVGIENARQRLRLAYGERASLELSPRPGGGTEARLRLPMEPK
jgi:sensor histidine kinase YesM